MGILTIAIMIAAFIGMIICAKKQKTNPNAKTFAILCLIVVVICAGKFLIDSGALGGMSREMKEALASYERFSEASAQAAGEYVSQKFGGQKAIIVASGGNAFDKQPNKLAGYVKQYLTGVNAEIKGLPYDPPQNDPGMGEEYMQAKYFNKLFDENKDTKLFILTISLPFDPSQAAKIKLWGKKDGQKLVLINADVHYLYGEIKNGVVAAAVVMRPDLKQEDFEKNAPNNLKKAFEARYILITPQNVDAIAKQYSSLFAK